MRSISIVALSLATLFICSLGYAQEAQAPTSQQAVAQTQPVQRTIFSYKKELNITDKQEKEAKVILENFRKKSMELNERIAALNAEVNKMIQEKRWTALIRPKIYELGKLRADLSYQDLVTSRKIEGVFTKDQLAKWQKIQVENQQQLMQAIKEAQEKQKQAAQSDKK